MTFDPVQMLLGVDRFADPLRLLGLTAQKCDALAVETALRRRLEQVFAHPQGRSAEADVVRQALRDAAAALKDPSRRAKILADIAGSARSQTTVTPPSPPGSPPPRPAASQPVRRTPFTPVPIALTMFDRQVMAALVAGGGWNAATRARIVALAGAYGVRVEGLIKVIQGLSEYAKSGGQRLSLAQITAGGQRMAPPSANGQDAATAYPGTAGGTLDWLNRVAPELRGEGGAWGVAKLVALSGLVVIIIGLVIVGALLNGRPALPGAGTGAGAGSDGSAQGATTSVERPPNPPPRPGPAENHGDGPAAPMQFVAWPTFKGSDRPAAAMDALDHSATLPQEIAAVSRKLLVEADPSDQVFREWRAAVETAASCWVLLDDPALAAIDKEVIELMYVASASPQTSDRVLAALAAPSTRLSEPIDVWRGAWMCGMLAQVSSRGDLSPAMVERAAGELAFALGAAPPADADPFQAGAGAWLHHAGALLVELTASDVRGDDFWELWLAAQRRLAGGERFNAAIMDAIESILASTIDLARSSTALNLLGRLVETADFSASPVVRRRMEEMFIGPDSASQRITAADLWILTSLLSQSSQRRWFSSDLVVPPEASDSHRRRKWARISDAWSALPMTSTLPGTPGIPGIPGVPDQPAAGAGHLQHVDAQSVVRWSALLERCAAELRRRDSAGLMGQLMDVTWLNESAARLAAGQDAAANLVMDRLEQNFKRITCGQEIVLTSGPAPDSASGPGQAIGADGQWAVALQDASNNSEVRVQQLQALRRTAGTDLGPLDAQALVREAYRGRSPDAKALAQTIIASHFSKGPNVVLAMLDQLADAPIGEPLAELIGRVTGRVLPGVRSAGWPLASRLALVERAMDLRNWPAGGIDLSEIEIAKSLANQLSAFRGEETISQLEDRPQEASRRLVEAWRTAAEKLPTDAPTPAPVGVLASRHRTRTGLAGGPIEQFVADRLAVLDLLTYVTVAQQPAQRASATAVLADSARKRAAMTHVLDQAVEVELAISRIWRLRLTADPASRAEAERKP